MKKSTRTNRNDDDNVSSSSSSTTNSTPLRVIVYALLINFVIVALYWSMSMTSKSMSNLLLVMKQQDTTEIAAAATAAATSHDTSNNSSTGINKNEFAPSSSLSTSRFDVISKYMYKIATLPNTTTHSRTPFVLNNNWKRGTGGLDDDDRRTIGDLYYHASSVFEFGLGESTQIAAAVQVPRYAGVDSDALWVNMAREYAINHTMDHFRFYSSDIGETKLWGWPVKPEGAKYQYNYQIATLMAEQEAFDVYLIDGRYRVACACVAFLHAIKHCNNNQSDHRLENVRVGVHDNDQNRWRKYNALEKVADVVTRNRKLWVYKLKMNDDDIEEKLQNLWEKFQAHLF